MGNYIIYTIIGLGCSFLVYHFILKSQKTFQFNRFFLLGSLILCLLAPIMEIEIFNTMPSLPKLDFQSESVQFESEDLLVGNTVETVQQADPFGYNILISIYLVVTVVFLLRYMWNLYRISKLTKNHYQKRDGLNIVTIEDQKNPSSFFNYLFINPKHLEEASYAKNVIQHETIHCKHLHTLDVLFVELLSCVFWFNPFVWLYKRQIRENHEFIADDYVIRSGFDITDYSNSIIYSGNNTHVMPFTSGFNFIHIKNRLIMLHQSKSSVFKRTFKSIIALTLFAAIFTLSSFKDDKPQLVVVVDAGHGGEDPGNLEEKDIVLQISQKLAFYSDQKVKIITTRVSDEFLSLFDRVDFINQQQPDLVLSLHCNAYKEEDKNGVEAFYYAKNDHYKESHAYSKTLVESQLNLFSSRGKIKTAGFYILKNSDCPGVVLELGFITNEKDKAILTNDNHQNEIAKSLYESLLKIRETKTN